MPKKLDDLEAQIKALEEQLKAMSEVLDRIVAWIMEKETGEVIELD
jgi:uncharacterized FlaG/YvyC family protein